MAMRTPSRNYGGRTSESAPSTVFRPSTGRRSSAISASSWTKQDKKDLIRLVFEFLQSHAFPHPVSVSSMQSPTNTLVHQIFIFLVQLFTNCPYTFDAKKVKAEQEIPMMFQKLGYQQVITASQIKAPASPNSWVAILNGFKFLIDVILIYEDVELMRESESQEPSVKSEAECVYRYLDETYAVFLNEGKEEFSEEDTILARDIKRVKNLPDEKDIQHQENLKTTLQEQLDNLKSRPDEPHRLELHIAELRRDTEKVKDWRKRLDQLSTQFDKKIEIAKEKATQLESERELLLKNCAELEKTKATQSISAEEAQRKHKELASLRTQAHQNQNRIEALQTNIDSAERAYALSTAKLETVLKQLQEFLLESPNVQQPGWDDEKQHLLSYIRNGSFPSSSGNAESSTNRSGKKCPSSLINYYDAKLKPEISHAEKSLNSFISLGKKSIEDTKKHIEKSKSDCEKLEEEKSGLIEKLQKKEKFMESVSKEHETAIRLHRENLETLKDEMKQMELDNVKIQEQLSLKKSEAESSSAKIVIRMKELDEMVAKGRSTLNAMVQKFIQMRETHRSFLKRSHELIDARFEREGIELIKVGGDDENVNDADKNDNDNTENNNDNEKKLQ